LIKRDGEEYKNFIILLLRVGLAPNSTDKRNQPFGNLCFVVRPLWKFVLQIVLFVFVLLQN